MNKNQVKKYLDDTNNKNCLKDFQSFKFPERNLIVLELLNRENVELLEKINKEFNLENFISQDNVQEQFVNLKKESVKFLLNNSIILNKENLQEYLSEDIVDYMINSSGFDFIQFIIDNDAIIDENNLSTLYQILCNKQNNQLMYDFIIKNQNNKNFDFFPNEIFAFIELIYCDNNLINELIIERFLKLKEECEKNYDKTQSLISYKKFNDLFKSSLNQALHSNKSIFKFLIELNDNLGINSNQPKEILKHFNNKFYMINKLINLELFNENILLLLNKDKDFIDIIKEKIDIELSYIKNNHSKNNPINFNFIENKKLLELISDFQLKETLEKELEDDISLKDYKRTPRKI